jgi:hypothetical protein
MSLQDATNTVLRQVVAKSLEEIDQSSDIAQ